MNIFLGILNLICAVVTIVILSRYLNDKHVPSRWTVTFFIIFALLTFLILAIINLV